MTISIKVTNSDTRETAIVSVEAVNADGSEQPGGKRVELKGGESTGDNDFYVHGGQALVVKEVQNG